MNLDAAVARYARVGRFARGFAKGKMSGDPVYARVLAYIRPGMRVLDVGCGEGYLLALAHETIGDLGLVGIDHDARRLGIAREALDDAGVTLTAGDARTAELPNADVVTALDVLHYQAPADQDALLARLAAAVRPGGVLLVRDARSDGGLASVVTGLSERVAVAVGRHKGDGVYLRPLAELEAAFSSLEGEVSREDCDEGTPFSNVLWVVRRSK